MATAQSQPEIPALNEADQAAIRRQLDHLLASPYFSHSKRFPNLLRYVVEQTLGGNGEAIKERTLGIEIFGRSADYETGNDPIVRVTAAEIRKRLGQYYAEPAHRDELRIQLPIGSYTPQFMFPQLQIETVAPPLPELTAQPAEAEAPMDTRGDGEVHATESPLKHKDAAETHQEERPSAPAMRAKPRRMNWIAVACVCVLASSLLTALGFLAYGRVQRAGFEYFWGPLLDDRSPALLCVADQLQDTGVRLRDAANPDQPRWHAFTIRDNAFTTVALDNVQVLLNLVSVLDLHHKAYVAKSEQATSLADLRTAPAVFIGGFDNAWTLRMTNKLRYRFANDAEMHYPRIIDSVEPNKPGWVSDQNLVGSTGSYQDYGIVARFVDRDTGRPAIIATGIGRCASLAAGQFVSTPTSLKELEEMARAHGNKPNLEIVFSTQVVDGNPGSPKILAFHSW